MANNDIISIFQAKIPTVVSYDAEQKKLIIGEAAKADGVNNTTNMFNFKMDLFLGEKEFSNKKKYWYGVTYKGKESIDSDTYTAKEVTKFFLKELLSDVDLPPRLIVGEPAVRENNLKENFRKNIREVFHELGYRNIDLFFEPFAVFQYYRHYEQYFPVANKSEIILVIDVGGGTFNSCIISTTNDGKLSRGGANMLPLGLQGQQCGGTLIDLELAKIVIEKCKQKGFLWKENPNDRAKSPILFRIEKAKISLSEQIGGGASITSSHAKITEKVFLPKGTLHPENEIEAELTGEDLKHVIRTTWRLHWGKILTKTVTEAVEKLKKPIDKIDKVIIAGGSSMLPFMREEVLTVLPTLVEKENIYIGNDLGNAVACGIACECKELVKSKKYPDLTVGTIAPCLLKDLYIGFKNERRGKLVHPKVDGYDTSGMLFSSPFEISRVTKSYELEVDFDFGDRLFYYFDNQPFTDNDPTHLNVVDFVMNLPASGRLAKKFQLDLHISENGAIRPIFNFKGKGAEAKKVTRPIECQEFYLEEKTIVQGDGFIGIDFGTSNSYVAKFLSQEKPIDNSSNVYPEFEVSHQALEKLRNKQVVINNLVKSAILTEECILRHAQQNKLLMIFHSNKIEGNELSKGETETIINDEKPAKMSKPQLEAVNLDAAFMWMLENLDGILSNPESFIRTINRMILDGISRSAGEYRTGPVKISGMEYIPPAAFVVPDFMQRLAEEIKNGVKDRSAIEFTASIHTKLVMIHPFEDGNGRTARLIMNAILLKSRLPLLVINFADKQRYFDAIVSANLGELSDFITFLLDCLDAEIDEIKSAVFVDEDVTKESNSTTRPTNTNKLFGTKLFSLLETKAGEMLREKEIEYNIWLSKFNAIKSDVVEVIDSFNASEFQDYGYAMRFFEYDELTFEKYVDLAKGRNVPRTWFFRVDISRERQYQKILFFFQHASPRLRKLPSLSPVSLCIARHDGAAYRRLLYEPVQLHEIAVSKDFPVFLLPEEHLKTEDTKSAISDYLIYDMIQNYI